MSGHLKTKPVTETTMSKTAMVKVGQKALNRIFPKKQIVVTGIRAKATTKLEIMALQRGLDMDHGCYLDVDGSFGIKTKRVASIRTIKKGDKGELVKAIQASLYCHGYSTKGIDGVFDDHTKKAVRSYQKDHDLKVDGVVGLKTIISMFA